MHANLDLYQREMELRPRRSIRGSLNTVLVHVIFILFFCQGCSEVSHEKVFIIRCTQVFKVVFMYVYFAFYKKKRHPSLYLSKLLL